MNINNPAARLHAILESCRSKELQQKKMLDAWRIVLGLADDTEDIITMSKMGRVYVLPHTIRKEIGQYSDLDLELFLGWQKDLALAFQSINFRRQFSDFGNKLTDSLLINIRFCAHELEKRQPEKVIDPKDLSDLKQMANALYDEVLKANLEPNLARYLLDHLYMIIDAIDDYSINGSNGLKIALDAIVGTVVTSSVIAKTAKESQFGEKFWGVAAKAALILELSKTAREIGDGLFKMITEP